MTRGQTARATPAGGGEKRWLSLELRLVADVGLVSEAMHAVIGLSILLSISLKGSAGASIVLFSTLSVALVESTAVSWRYAFGWFHVCFFI